ncbi:predicted protein [Sclerotinia sclerotiorum 1980 UF-70]|uniref:Uncharacterized protein n=1 Tax=Sclerotinia sclerotiorum (strain ATCC 18683 / 1980 / Ss-1) TaxID=665079 RepID=A7EB24_SCLS1|nr:predicted protein [Sclerotinia sclerotiorum 1980 UF-70]EDN99652.1 predicted protein [Sclerotinia sclerotiorum 1980 UF-70]
MGSARGCGWGLGRLVVGNVGGLGDLACER